MIKLHPVKNGPRPNNTFTSINIDQNQLSEIKSKIKLKYLGHERPQFFIETPSKYAEHLVLEIEENDESGMDSGFYKLEIHPRDIKQIIPSL